MASVTKTACGKWLVRVRPRGRKGYSKTFSKKILADQWGAAQESDIEHLEAGVMLASNAAATPYA